jgi:hypothetical protein
MWLGQEEMADSFERANEPLVPISVHRLRALPLQEEIRRHIL